MPRLYLLQSEGVEIIEWPEAPLVFRVPIPAKASATFVSGDLEDLFPIEADDYRLVTYALNLFVYEPIPPVR
jgi:hypothetical protein